jgi:hypothetical protein
MERSSNNAVWQFLSAAGRKGHQAVLRKYGKAQMVKWGKRGG